MGFEINDIDTYLEDPYEITDEYHEGSVSYYEHIKIVNDDIDYVDDLYALARGVLAVLQTRVGEIDGVGMENFGSRLLTLRGMPLNNHTTDLAKVFVEETIGQYQGRVLGFPIVRVIQKDRWKITIHIRISSIYGEADISLDI